MSQETFDRELDIAIDLAHQAGKIMNRYFQSDGLNTEWKSDNTPVTQADIEVNKLVVKTIEDYFDDYEVIGEEESLERDGRYAWVVDPIDGTVPFNLGIPVSTFSLALVDKNEGQPVVGVAYDPFQDKMFTAVRGEGAKLNGAPISTSKNPDLKQTSVSVLGGTISGDKGHADFNHGNCINLLRSEGAKNISLQSFVYVGVMVAEGRLSGTIMGYGSPWDAAAAALIVQEAGGIAADVYGQPRRYDEFANGIILAANQSVFEKLVSVVEQSVT